MKLCGLRPCWYLHGPAQNNVDMSLSKQFAVYKSARFALRLDAVQCAQPHFASLTDHTITNLPYNAAGELVNKNGFGSINGVNIPRTLQLVTRLTF